MLSYQERFTYGRSTIPPQLTKKQSQFQQYLQIFEKPTMIYKKLGVHHKVTPLFLTRNLSYMHGRSKRIGKASRKQFVLDDTLSQVLVRKNKEAVRIIENECIILAAIEICSPSAVGFNKSVTVDVYLINHGSGNVTNAHLTSADKIHVGSCPNIPIVNATQLSSSSNCLSVEMTKFYYDILLGKQWSLCFEVVIKQEKFVGLLLLIGASDRYTLVDGVYEIPLSKAVNFKLASMDDIGVQVLKVQFGWANESTSSLPAITPKQKTVPSVQHPKENDATTGGVMETEDSAEGPQIEYNFVWGRKGEHQNSSVHPASICPWCGLNCSKIYSMMKHLCVCHSRFNFVYKPNESYPHYIVDVTLNASYDGSYEGNAWKLYAQPNMVFNGPQFRTSFTEFLVWRKNPKTPPSLEEFLPTKVPQLPKRPHKTGHNSNLTSERTKIEDSISSL